VSGIAAAGGTAFAVQAELGTSDAVHQLLTRLDAGLADQGLPPELDVLVNNAAIALPGPVEAIDPGAFDHLLAVNVAAPFFLIQGALTRMRDGGRIVNVSSGVTRVAMPENIAYAMSKGALDILTRTLAKGVGARGITVNAVSPGVVDTDANACWLRDNPGAQAFVSRRPRWDVWAGPTTWPTRWRSWCRRTAAG
jgi:3-oxoacyl-[acyl-carrier protein] reductase